MGFIAYDIDFDRMGSKTIPVDQAGIRPRPVHFAISGAEMECAATRSHLRARGHCAFLPFSLLISLILLPSLPLVRSFYRPLLRTRY
eukprot:2676432-Rhodomonas_salina.2